MAENEATTLDLEELERSGKYPRPVDLIDFVPGVDGCEVVLREDVDEAELAEHEENDGETEDTTTPATTQSTQPGSQSPIRTGPPRKKRASPGRWQRLRTRGGGGAASPMMSPTAAALNAVMSSPGAARRARSALRCCYIPPHIVVTGDVPPPLQPTAATTTVETLAPAWSSPMQPLSLSMTTSWSAEEDAVIRRHAMLLPLLAAGVEDTQSTELHILITDLAKELGRTETDIAARIRFLFARRNSSSTAVTIATPS